MLASSVCLKRIAAWGIAFVAVFGLPLCACCTDLFPTPPEIQPAVKFWVSIYTRFGLTHGVVHDSRHLEIVYGVIDLEPPETPGAGRINDRRMRHARNRYRRMIDRYLQNPGSERPDIKRMVALFGPTPDAKLLEQAKRRIRCQVGQRDRFRNGLVRSAPHADVIGRILREAGLPEDLIYLAHVESSFNSEARSKSGAAGIWQFTRRTGRHYLQIDQALDERLDPLRSSEAAAQLLKANYQSLGSWPLAITAYNHGIAGMRRAQRRHKTYAAIFAQYRSRRFGFASRNFYPEFLAAREAASKAHLYFQDIPSPIRQATFEVILDGFAPFHAIVDHFALDEQTVCRLNPALRPAVVQGLLHVPKHYALRLPAHEWRNHLAFNARIPPEIMHTRQKKLPVYRVRKGDTLAAIASRHNLTVADLVAANNLPDRGNRIYVNQTLRLPMDERSL
jgi:membrane-bound lytic murein transglycosylase D